MWFLLFKVFKTGVSQAKKHKAKKNASSPDADADKAGTTTQMFSLDNASGTNTSTRNPFKTILDFLLRLLQFALGLAVVGLYGQDLSGTSSSNKGIDGRWLYAVIVGALSSVTALLYLIHLGITKKKKTTPFYCAENGVVGVFLFAWEGVVCLLWLVCFGIFGKVFLPASHGAAGYEGKMWRAVWVDLVCWGVWGASMVWFGVRWWKARAGASNAGGDVEKGGNE
ncbi:hypothetical protein SI65_03832 [Aspergillus cristatus]|uniref:MARVEL domain-containing protein n=1 Tax=Aspergillus cristatus TaxID=573508 RepID=A0A1E3BIL0_ASPCR|nr:hypothetical protein SI65_03832 [Aspergillus cristatus]